MKTLEFLFIALLLMLSLTVSANSSTENPSATNENIGFFKVHDKQPNSGGKVIIPCIKTNEDVHVRLTDLAGKIIFDKNFHEYHSISYYEVNLDHRNLNNGVYVLQVIKGNEMETKKVVIQH